MKTTDRREDLSKFSWLEDPSQIDDSKGKESSKQNVNDFPFLVGDRVQVRDGVGLTMTETRGTVFHIENDEQGRCHVLMDNHGMFILTPDMLKLELEEALLIPEESSDLLIGFGYADQV